MRNKLQKHNHWRCSLKGVLKNFTISTEKHLYQSLFLNKVPGLKYAALSKRNSGIGVFL